MCNAAEVCNDGLNTIAFALDFGLQTLHLVAVEWVGNILQCVSKNKQGYIVESLTRRMLTVAMIAVLMLEIQKASRFFCKGRETKRTVVGAAEEELDMRGLSTFVCRLKHEIGIDSRLLLSRRTSYDYYKVFAKCEIFAA